jgi:hypothetical protein
MKNLLLLVMLFSLMSCKSGKEKPYSSNWQSQELIIDGQDKDWDSTMRFSDTISKLLYDIRNDGENLYLIFETSDNSMCMKLMQKGFKVSLCHKGPMPGKEMHDAKGLRPEKEMRDIKGPRPGKEMHDTKGHGTCKEMRDSAFRKGPMQGGDSSLCMKRPMPIIDSAVVNGFKFTNGWVKAGNPEKGKMDFAIGMKHPMTLVYEIKIPLRELYGDGYDVSKIASDKIDVMVTVEALEKPAVHEVMPKECGMHRGQAGAPPEKEMSGGKPGGHPEEGMKGMPPAGMEHHGMKLDTVLLSQKQILNYSITLSAGK